MTVPMLDSRRWKMASDYYSMVDYIVGGPALQAAVISTFAPIQSRWVAPHAGYRSARFLISADGQFVRCIVHWASEAHFRDFERSIGPEFQTAVREALRDLGCKVERYFFTLAGEVLPEEESHLNL